MHANDIEMHTHTILVIVPHCSWRLVAGRASCMYSPMLTSDCCHRRLVGTGSRRRTRKEAARTSKLERRALPRSTIIC